MVRTSLKAGRDGRSRPASYAFSMRCHGLPGRLDVDAGVVVLASGASYDTVRRNSAIDQLTGLLTVGSYRHCCERIKSQTWRRHVIKGITIVDDTMDVLDQHDNIGLRAAHIVKCISGNGRLVAADVTRRCRRGFLTRLDAYAPARVERITINKCVADLFL